MTYFYCCYLLQSEPKPRSFYIGSTPDPQRRIRQHNGELTQGARRTGLGAKRPWKMIATVSGFQSKIAALQFEHAWQHAYQTRLIPTDRRVSSNKNTTRSIHQHLANLRLLVSSPAFRRFPLKVWLLADAAVGAWNANRYKVELDEARLAIQVGPHEETWEKMLAESRLSAAAPKVVCCLTGTCPACDHTEPLQSFAMYMLSTDPEPTALLPATGSCPGCKKSLHWHQVIRRPAPQPLHDSVVDDE